MKNTTRIILVIACFSLILIQSCRYEEGPVISFRKAENRLIGEWQVKSFEINKIDCTANYNEKCNCYFRFNYDKTEKYFSIRDCKPDLAYIHGYYEFIKGANKTKIRTNLYTIAGDDTIKRTYRGLIGTNRTADWKILRLTNEELKISSEYENNEYTINFTKTEYIKPG